MQVVYGHHNAPAWDGAAIAIGNFDGVHLGHQHVVRRAREIATERGLARVVVVTFDPHPTAIFHPDTLELIARIGGTVDPLQQLGLAITLPHNHFEPKLGGFAFDQRRQLIVGGAAVDLRLAGAEQIEVRAVQHVDRLGNAFVGKAFGHSNPGNVGCGWPGL
mgnify:CR=1 FL=1